MVASIFCGLTLNAQKPSSPAYPHKLQTLGDHLRKRRLDLGLKQIEVAEILGAHEMSIVNWEKNIKSPTPKFIPKIIELLGYNPLPDISSMPLAERITSYRKMCGFSQEEFAKIIGVDPGTLGKWENGKSTPRKETMDILDTQMQSQLYA